jgi:multiple sugar transport system substrate-binding protein
MSTPKLNAPMSRRAFLRSVSLGAGLLALTPLIQACGGSAAPAATQAPAAKATEAPAAAATKAPEAKAVEPTKAPATSGGAKTQITFIAMDYDQNLTKDTTALMDAFNKSQDKVEAKVEVVGWPDGETVLLTRIGAGQAPDIANHSSGGLLMFNAAGENEPLDDHLGADFLKPFVKSSLDAFTVEGKLIGMPYFLDPRGMYWRTDLFEKAGLKVPDTWDDVIQVAKALTKPPDMYGFGMDNGDNWWYAVIGAYGLVDNLDVMLPVNMETKKCQVANEQGIAAVQWLTDLIRTHKVVQPNPENANRDADEQPLFYAGKLAIITTGSWLPTIIKDNAPDMKFDVAPIPVAKAGMKHVNAFWPDGVCMFKQSKQKDAASELLKFMFSKENRLLWAKQRGVVPEREDVGTDPAYAVSPFEKYFFEQVKISVNVFKSPFPKNQPKNLRTIQEGYIKAWLGEMPVKEAMQAAAAQVDKDNGVA